MPGTFALAGIWIYKGSLDTMPASGTCPTGKTSIEQYCIDMSKATELSSSDITANSFTAEGVKFFLNPGNYQKDDQDNYLYSYYKVELKPVDTTITTSSGTNKCEDEMEYTIVITLHDAKSDGSAFEAIATDELGNAFWIFC